MRATVLIALTPNSSFVKLPLGNQGRHSVYTRIRVEVTPCRHLALPELYHGSDVHLNSKELEEGAFNCLHLNVARD